MYNIEPVGWTKREKVLVSMGISGFTTTTRSEEIGTGISQVKIFFKVGKMAFCFTRTGKKRNSRINVKEHLDTNSYRPYCKDHDELHERDSQTAQILSCSSMMSTNIIFPDSKIYRNIYACWQQLFLWVSADTFFCSCFFICQIWHAKNTKHRTILNFILLSQTVLYLILSHTPWNSCWKLYY